MTDLRAELLAELDRLEALAQAARAELDDMQHEDFMALLAALHGRPALGQYQRDPDDVLRQLAGVRAVVEMHAPSSCDLGGCTESCGMLSTEGDAFYGEWPCDTIRVLYDAYCGSADA